jgi:hypothetical protein
MSESGRDLRRLNLWGALRVYFKENLQGDQWANGEDKVRNKTHHSLGGQDPVFIENTSKENTAGFFRVNTRAN